MKSQGERDDNPVLTVQSVGRVSVKPFRPSEHSRCVEAPLSMTQSLVTKDVGMLTSVIAESHWMS